MKLIWLLILSLIKLSFEEKDFKNYGYVGRSSPKTITYSQYSYCVYVDMSNFSGHITLHVKVTVKNGYFNSNEMYYGSYHSSPSIEKYYTLKQYETVDSYESGTKRGNKYDYYTQHYYISVNTLYDYYFFSIPSFEGDEVVIEIEPSGITVGAIVGITIGGLIFIVLVIYFIYRYRRKKNNLSSEPIEITQPIPTYTPPMNEYAPTMSPTYPTTGVY